MRSRRNHMQINITGHHIEVTPALHNYVTKKLQKIHNHFSNITIVHVTLSIENKKFQQRAEATLHLAKAKGEIFAESEAEDMYAAIDLLIDKLDKQVIKHKEKLSQHGDGQLG